MLFVIAFSRHVYAGTMMNFSAKGATKCNMLYHIALDLGHFCLLSELDLVNLFEWLLPRNRQNIRVWCLLKREVCSLGGNM